MVWARLDDQFHAHPKLAELDPDLMLAAVGLHTLVLSWCASQLTDGHVPAAQVRRLAGQPVENLTAELVRVGLWEKATKAFIVHDYLDYNPSRAQVVAERERKSEGGRRGGLASGRARREAYPQGHAEAYAEGYAQASAEDMLAHPFAKRSGSSGTPVPVPVPVPILKTGNARAREARPPVDNSPEDEYADVDFGEEKPTEDKKTDGQRLTGHYVDERRRVGSAPTDRQIGILAQIVGEKLKGGASPDTVRRAISAMVGKGKPPSTLPAFIDEYEAAQRRQTIAGGFRPPPEMTREEKRRNYEAFLQTPEGQKVAALSSGIGRDMPCEKDMP